MQLGNKNSFISLHNEQSSLVAAVGYGSPALESDTVRLNLIDARKARCCRNTLESSTCSQSENANHQQGKLAKLWYWRIEVMRRTASKNDVSVKAYAGTTGILGMNIKLQSVPGF